MTKLPRHQDIDSQIHEVSFRGLFVWALLAFVLCLITATLLVLLVLLWLGFRVTWSYFFYGPISVLAIAAIWLTAKFWRLLATILDSLIMTVEAWLARAGYSVDINRDGYIGHFSPVEIDDDYRPIKVSGPSGTKMLLASDSKTPLKDLPEPTELPEPKRRLITLNNGTRVPVETVTMVIVGLIEGRGLGRKHWVPGRLDRQTYEGLMSLFSEAGIITGRKSKFAGKLNIETLDQANKRLGGILG